METTQAVETPPEDFYRGKLKKIHRPPGEVSLMVQCLRDGTLDVCLATGRPINRDGVTYKTRVNHGGYTTFVLARHVHRGGNVYTRRDKQGRKRTDRRKMMTVFVHRLVKAKAEAVKRFGDQWREKVVDLPRGVDVEHKNRHRWDNRAVNLMLETEVANRQRRPMTPEEEERLAIQMEDAYAEAF